MPFRVVHPQIVTFVVSFFQTQKAFTKIPIKNRYYNAVMKAKNPKNIPGELATTIGQSFLGFLTNP